MESGLLDRFLGEPRVTLNIYEPRIDLIGDSGLLFNHTSERFYIYPVPVNARRQTRACSTLIELSPNISVAEPNLMTDGQFVA